MKIARGKFRRLFISWLKADSRSSTIEWAKINIKIRSCVNVTQLKQQFAFLFEKKFSNRSTKIIDNETYDSLIKRWNSWRFLSGFHKWFYFFFIASTFFLWPFRLISLRCDSNIRVRAIKGNNRVIMICLVFHLVKNEKKIARFLARRRWFKKVSILANLQRTVNFQNYIRRSTCLIY